MNLHFYCVDVHTSLFALANTDKSCSRNPRYLKCLEMKELMETNANGMSRLHWPTTEFSLAIEKDSDSNVLGNLGGYRRGTIKLIKY